MESVTQRDKFEEFQEWLDRFTRWVDDFNTWEKKWSDNQDAIQNGLSGWQNGLSGWKEGLSGWVSGNPEIQTYCSNKINSFEEKYSKVTKCMDSYNHTISKANTIQKYI